MQIIAVDIGNSATKLLAGETLIRLPHTSEATPCDFPKVLEQQLPSLNPGEHLFWSVVSVNPPAFSKLVDWIERNHPNDRVESITRRRVPLDVIDSYRDTVGIDRLVAAWSAVVKYMPHANSNGSHIIVVDAGTAVTIDLVALSPQGTARFEGGLIFPGADSSAAILGRATPALPLVSPGETADKPHTILGTTTESAIANGLVRAQAHAVAGIVNQLEMQHPAAHVCITGGSATSMLCLLPDEMTQTWHLEPQLVPQGALAIGQQILASEQAG